MTHHEQDPRRAGLRVDLAEQTRKATVVEGLGESAPDSLHAAAAMTRSSVAVARTAGEVMAASGTWLASAKNRPTR